MDNIFIVGAVISIVFFIVKFIEMRFIEKENKPLKYLTRDSLLVYFSTICGHFIIGQVSQGIEKLEGGSSTPVFIDNPSF
jgi:hypothetical protein